MLNIFYAVSAVVVEADFAVSADHRVKVKEVEKLKKYLDLARELKRLWNVNVTMMHVVVGVL